MSKVCVFDHPLILHKLSILRDSGTSVKEFRELISEIAQLMCYEATRDLPLEEVQVETPVAMATCHRIAGKKHEHLLGFVVTLHFRHRAKGIGGGVRNVRALEALFGEHGIKAALRAYPFVNSHSFSLFRVSNCFSDSFQSSVSRNFFLKLLVRGRKAHV